MLWRQTNSEPLYALGSIEDDLLLSILANMASINHLVHELCCSFVGEGLLLSLLDPGSQVGQLC